LAHFRFRAQVALDLRRKLDEEARRALADAEREVLNAYRALSDVEARLDEAFARARDDERETVDPARCVWHRNWIKRVQQDVAGWRRVLADRQEAAHIAKGHAQQARRRLRSLEKLRDRAWHAWEQDARRQEQRQLDELGSVRYVQQHRERGGM
jgi:flagellar export protein FliJ